MIEAESTVPPDVVTLVVPGRHGAVPAQVAEGPLGILEMA